MNECLFFLNIIIIIIIVINIIYLKKNVATLFGYYVVILEISCTKK